MAGNTVYSSSYDDWGNMSGRSYSGIASTLSYDALDHLVHWDGHTGTSEDYLYDASGERVLRRAVKSNGKEIFTYPFGLMDIRYSSSGVQVLENDYYTLAGRLIGEQESGVTVFLLTDELGSVLTSISAVAGSAAVTSNQAYSPYGTQRYRKGAVPTDKGFTGQYLDASGLNYDHARYYDAVVGRFVSADIKQGNMQGMDPYSYVGNDPETLNDPTGQRFCDPTGNNCGQPCGGSCTTPGSGGGGGGGDHWVCNSVGCYDNGVLMYTRTVTPPSSCGGCKWVQPGFKQVVKKGPTPEEIAAGQDKASEIALEASRTFRTISNWLWVAVGLVGVLFLLNLENPILAGALAGLVGALTILAAQAGEISGRFSDETTNGLGWFTKANLTKAMNDMAAFIGESLALPSFFGGILAVVGMAMKTGGEKLFVGGTTLALGDVIGSSAMLIGVIKYTNEQENVVLT